MATCIKVLLFGCFLLGTTVGFAAAYQERRERTQQTVKLSTEQKTEILRKMRNRLELLSDLLDTYARVKRTYLICAKAFYNKGVASSGQALMNFVLPSIIGCAGSTSSMAMDDLDVLELAEEGESSTDAFEIMGIAKALRAGYVAHKSAKEKYELLQKRITEHLVLLANSFRNMQRFATAFHKRDFENFVPLRTLVTRCLALLDACDNQHARARDPIVSECRIVLGNISALFTAITGK